MVIGYIKYKRRSKNFLDRFKIIEIDNFNNNYLIDIYENENKNNKKEKADKKNKIIKKVIKVIKQYKIDTIVFSKDIEKEFQKDSVELLSKENYQVTTLNGKRLMKYMNFEIISYILEKQNADMKNEDIYILFKNDKSIDLSFRTNLEILKEFLNKYIYNFRVTNLVANDIRELRRLQEEILESENILISVSNNKRKALKRAKYLLNVNLNKSEIDKYKINRDAIIINLEQTVIYNDPSFNGINVNYFELEIPDEYIESFEKIGEKFDIVTLYESILLEYSENVKKSKNSNKNSNNLGSNRYNNLYNINYSVDDSNVSNNSNIQNVSNYFMQNSINNIVKERIKEDKIKIKYLIGNNGKIEESELKQMVKNYHENLDKNKKLV